MGQKLCTKTPVEYKQMDLPDDLDWPPERWNPEHRTNRKYVADSGTAPCKTACPAHIAVQGYIKLAAQGKYMDALELIKKENPFPAVCGRICNRRCEDECTRGSIDKAVAIDEVKKFIADRELDRATRFVPKKLHHFDIPLEPECRNAVAQHAAGLGIFVKHRDLVVVAGKVVCAG